MRIIDRVLGWFLVLLGCTHNFLAAPLTFEELSHPALWFLSAGLALWFAGFINLLRADSRDPSKMLLIFCLLTNISLLAFVLLYAFIEGNWAAPEAIALIGSVAALTVLSVVTILKTRQSLS